MNKVAFRELAVPALALLAVNAAAGNVWSIEEHYFRRGPLWHAWAAWAASMAVIMSVVLSAVSASGPRRTSLILRAQAVAAAVYLLLRVPANQGWIPAGSGGWRLLVAVAVAGALTYASRGQNELWQRGFRAALVASVFFLATPLVWQSLGAPNRVRRPAPYRPFTG